MLGDLNARFKSRAALAYWAITLSFERSSVAGYEFPQPIIFLFT
jgi:hypothetical protein